MQPINPSDTTRDRPEGEAIGDENVERLLGRAYAPEAPSAEFSARVQRALLTAAEVRARQHAAAQPPTTLFRKARRRVGRFPAWLAVAVTLLIGTLVLWRMTGSPDYVRDRRVVRIDGQAYRPAEAPETRLLTASLIGQCMALGAARRVVWARLDWDEYTPERVEFVIATMVPAVLAMFDLPNTKDH